MGPGSRPGRHRGACAHSPGSLDLPFALPLPVRRKRRIGSKRNYGTAGGRQGHRYDDRADGALCHPDARRLWRRRHQDRNPRRRRHAADRSDPSSRHGAGVPQHQPQQTQYLPRSEEAQRARRGAAADRISRRAGLQRPTAGDGTIAARLRHRLEDQSAPRLCWRVRFWSGRAVCRKTGL